MTIEIIKKEVANHFGKQQSDINDSKELRQICVYFSKIYTKKTFLEISTEFGGKGHSFAMYSIKTVENLCFSDAKFRLDIRLLTDRFNKIKSQQELEIEKRYNFDEAQKIDIVLKMYYELNFESRQKLRSIINNR